MRRRDFVASVIGGAVWPWAACAQQTASQTASDHDLFVYFYNDPQPGRLVGFLERYQKIAPSWNSFPPVAGFFAIVFRQHPDWIGKLIPDSPDARTAMAIAAALRLSGLSSIEAGLHSRITAARVDPTLQAELADLPRRVEDIQIATPTHLDVLWGASFASGDERYPGLIANFLAATANRSELIALDIARTAVEMLGGPRGFVGQLKDKYGERETREIIYAATAAWGLSGNARRHPFIAKFLTKYIASNSGSLTAKILSTLQPTTQN